MAPPADTEETMVGRIFAALRFTVLAVATLLAVVSWLVMVPIIEVYRVCFEEWLLAFRRVCALARPTGY
jgi:hypothetical protein